MKLEILNISNNFERDYQGKWLFAYYADYILDIKTEKRRAIIMLYDTMEQEELDLTLIKYSQFYIELFVKSDDGNFFLKLYPILRKGSIGIEIRYSEVFAKSRLIKNSLYDFSQFISIGDAFPDWVNGIWHGKISSIYFVIEKVRTNMLKIAAKHQITRSVEIASSGYIGHSGILLTLCNNEWVDKTVIGELQFDYSNNSVIYIEKMLLPARLC